VGVELYNVGGQAGGRADMMKLIVAFRNTPKRQDRPPLRPAQPPTQWISRKTFLAINVAVA